MNPGPYPDPDTYPHIEPADGASVLHGGEEMFRCTMYGGTFDREAYELTGGQCPICSDVEDVQRRTRGGL